LFAKLNLRVTSAQYKKKEGFMKNRVLAAIAAVLFCLSVTACSTLQRHKQETGLVAGGVAGGVIGSAVSGGTPLGAGIGAVGGAYAGSEIGKRMK
jgi:osmotically inducible lipoprotein OsmB